MKALRHRYGLPLTLVMLAICVVWLIGMVVGPDLFLIDMSFRPNLTADAVGGPQDVHTLQNYEALFRNTVHYGIFLKTLWGASLVTALALVLCYPVAYYMAQVARPQAAALCLVLLIIPFWINEILRTFAWYIILSYNGPLNRLLLALGLIDQPIRYFSGSSSVVIGMAYAYILYMAFPIYNAIQTLDRSQIEAARDLGASSWRIHRRIVIPHAKPGIAVGCVMTFVLAAGSYAVPAILGGPGNRWFTEIVYDWFFAGENWNQGAAYAFLLLAACLGFILAMMAIFRVKLGELAK